MIISEADITTWIRHFQCNLGTKADVSSKAFAFRKKNRNCLMEDLILIDNVIRILYNYTSFDSEPTYAYSFTFTKTSTSSDTVTLTIGADPYPYVSSTSGGEDIVDYYYDLFNNNVQPTDLKAERDGNTYQRNRLWADCRFARAHSYFGNLNG